MRGWWCSPGRRWRVHSAPARHPSRSGSPRSSSPWGRGGRSVLAAALGLLASGLAHQARAGLSPLPTGTFRGVVVLVSDPEPSFGGWRADVRSRSGRLELSARGGAGGRLGSRRAGERLEVEGRVEALADPGRAAARHVRARLVADRVTPVDRGTPFVRLVNGIRSLVIDGAASLPTDQRALFTGFVLGDDRGSSVVVADDFEGAGLSHLLVVSGQNVVFVVAVATPLIARLRRRGRFVATIGLLVVFAAVTRFEPSVLRATVMAGVGAVAVVLGRPVSGVRVLALAVTGLVLLDPLLVQSLGFRLSTAATAGIIVLARPLAAVLPGPAWLRLAAAVTLSAQAAVAPLLVPTFGPMPVAALPANLLAEPVAGLVMMWGCTAGLVAGMAPGWLAWLLHLPTRLGLWWVAEVARVGAAAPLGRVGPPGDRRRRGAARCRGGGRSAAAAPAPRSGAGGGGGGGRGAGRRAPRRWWRRVRGWSRWAGPSCGGGASVPPCWSSPAMTGPMPCCPACASAASAVSISSCSARPGPRRPAPSRCSSERVDVDLVWAPRGSPAPDAVEPPSERRGGGRPAGAGPLVGRTSRGRGGPRRRWPSGGPGCRWGRLGSAPCTSTSAPPASTSRTGRSSWGSSTAPPTRSTTRAPTTSSTPSSARPSSWSTTAPTSSTSAG